MSHTAMDKLMAPESVAVVGATDRQGAFGWYATKNVMKARARYYLVNPNKDEILGVRAYKALSDLPEVVDCAIICTPREVAVQNLLEAAKLGTKAAVISASGFGEEKTETGQALEAEVHRIAHEYGMKICGPNCAGIMNNVDKTSGWTLMGTEFDMETRRTGIAMITQSGGTGINFMERENMDVSFAISSGNGKVVTIDEYFEYCVERPEVKVIISYLEGLSNPARFIRALARAAELKKPVIILKSGRSEQSAIAAASHTGSMAGSFKAYEAIFKRFGVVLVDSFDELLVTAQAFSAMYPNYPKNNNCAVLTGSGGDAAVCADLGDKCGLKFNPFNQETKEALLEYLPSYASPNNPLDFTASNSKEETVCALMEIIGTKDPSLGSIVMSGNALQEENAMTRQMEQLQGGRNANEYQIAPMVRYKKTSKNPLPVMMMPTYEDRRQLKYVKQIEALGIPVLSPSEMGFRNVASLIKFGIYDHSWRTMDVAIPTAPHGSKTVSYSESESQKVLSGYGVPVPSQMMITCEEDITKLANTVPFPVVMKISSPDILHKSDIGGVKLNIKSVEEAKTAYAEILANARANCPNARIEGVLACEMVGDGAEMIVGINNDATFGPMLLVGVGGVSVEVYKDVALSPCPVNHAEAKEMIESLKGYKLLTGFRGQAPRDIDALADLMVKVSVFASEKRNTLKEMDLNPVKVFETGKGCKALDAVLVEYTDCV